MKKFYIILLALIVVLAMIIPSVVPVMAKNPQDNKPVAWVSWGGTNASNKVNWGAVEMVSILVKQLADGSSVGHFRSYNRDVVTKEKVNYDWSIVDSFFEVDEVSGAKIANILTTMEEEEYTWYFWWKLVDNGEPGRNDQFLAYIWVYPIGPGIPGQNVAPPQWPYPTPVTMPPSWPPPWWWPFAGDSGDPSNPNFGALLTLDVNNIQVHVTDDYVPPDAP